MACTIHVNGRSNSLVHKGSGGKAKCTLPDVCKTPSPGGPVPIPYPVILSTSSDLKKGSKKVKFDGGNSAAIKGSEFSRCSGDEAGTAGGVKSSTNMKEATWILFSFDVKIEGKNACRLSDKMMMNHGNTACLSGCDNPNVSAEEQLLQEIMCECDRNPPPAEPPGRCKEIGTAKHQCCEDAINSQQPPGIGGERGYLKNGKPANPRGSYSPAPPKGSGFPDACTVDGNGNPTQFFDFKFPCGGEADSNFYFPPGKSQYDKYLKIGKKLEPPVTKPPRGITSRNCP